MKEIIFKNRIIDTYNESNTDRKEFWLSDLYGYIKDTDMMDTTIVECTDIFIPKEERRLKKASNLLEAYIKENIKEDKLYFVRAGFSSHEFTEDEYESLSKFQREEIFNNLDKFYRYNEFININRFIGDYNNSIIYVYMNSAALDLLKVIGNKSYKNHSVCPIEYDNLNILDTGTVEVYKTRKYCIITRPGALYIKSASTDFLRIIDVLDREIHLFTNLKC